MLISGSGALKGNMRALNQSVSTQVSMLMKDPSKLARRSGVPQQQRPRVLCHMDPKTSAAEADKEADDALHADVAAERDEEVDFEMFHDGEFYAQLLKEFLEGSGAGKHSVNGVYSQVCFCPSSVPEEGMKTQCFQALCTEKLRKQDAFSCYTEAQGGSKLPLACVCTHCCNMCTDPHLCMVMLASMKTLCIKVVMHQNKQHPKASGQNCSVKQKCM